jgi:hypothetical protein
MKENDFDVYQCFLFSGRLFRYLEKINTGKLAFDTIREIANGDLTLFESPAEANCSEDTREAMRVFAKESIEQDKKIAQSIIDGKSYGI